MIKCSCVQKYRLQQEVLIHLYFNNTYCNYTGDDDTAFFESITKLRKFNTDTQMSYFLKTLSFKRPSSQAVDLFTSISTLDIAFFLL